MGARARRDERGRRCGRRGRRANGRAGSSPLGRPARTLASPRTPGRPERHAPTLGATGFRGFGGDAVATRSENVGGGVARRRPRGGTRSRTYLTDSLGDNLETARAARGPRASGTQGQPPATLLTPDETHRTRLRAHRHRRDRAARRHGGARRRHYTRRVNRGESKSRHDGRCVFARELRRGARRMNGARRTGNAGFIRAFADGEQSDDVGPRLRDGGKGPYSKMHTARG